MQKKKLPLRDLITAKRLNEMRIAYNKPQMTRPEAYQKLAVVRDYIETLKLFKL
ncbi:hypothetical protein ABDD95_20415 [Mucilaginibacter sp. PAMB04274]|uniref:hypothetical protein n=1 Tax=Mucilaginibacter sp. PAMB04274 TaxID=3138568 RepID=UPI0031F69AF5